MKTLKGIILVLALAFFTGCEIYTDDEGNLNNTLGSVFEVQGDFTSANGYSLLFDFPNTLKVYNSDLVLVYILWEQNTDKFGKVSDVWRLLPQTVVLNEGVLQYNFDYTVNDVKIFLDGTINMATLLPAESQDQVFRVVVLPADYAVSKSFDLTNYDQVMKSLNLNTPAISKMDLSEINPAAELK